MKHLKYILILALSSAMGTLQAQDLKELMKENRENREANYAKWGPTSDHNGMGYVAEPDSCWAERLLFLFPRKSVKSTNSLRRAVSV